MIRRAWTAARMHALHLVAHALASLAEAALAAYSRAVDDHKAALAR